MPLLNKTQEPITFEMWLIDCLEKAERQAVEPRTAPKDQTKWIDWRTIVVIVIVTLALWYWSLNSVYQ